MEIDILDELLLVARTMRENQEIFVPIITWQPTAGHLLIANLTVLTGDTRADLDLAFQQLRDISGPPAWFAITLDSYARNETPDTIPAESLEEAFRTGDLGVVEQMVTIIMNSALGELEMIRQVYRYIPSEGWEWEEPELIASPDDAVTTAVRMFQ